MLPITFAQSYILECTLLTYPHTYTHQPTYPLTILPWIIVGYRIPGYPSYEGHASIDPDFDYRITSISMIDDERTSTIFFGEMVFP